jgi:SAM-dependent MidA family methyltransferase
MSLRPLIADLIRRDGPIPFSRYMAMCLYEPGLGYYARPREQFGKAGDFYTSSDVHALFGRLLCRQFEQMWQALGSPQSIDIVELGPGRGLFALDVLDWADKKFPQFADALHYRLVETSEHLRLRQSERLQPHIQGARVSLHSELEDAANHCSDSVIIFGNEFFDALPVELIDHRGSVRVALDASGNFLETFVPPSPEELAYLDRNSVQPESGGRVEAAIAAQDWMRHIGNVLAARRGFALFIDYGYTREEQLAGRHRDTLMTYRQHAATANPYEAPGEQDITTHVNFTALRNVAEQQGLRFDGLLTQAAFLLAIGETNDFADAFADCVLPQERAKVALQLKHLVTPAGIGEIFHVLSLSHGLNADTVRHLSGLKYAR